MDTAAQPAAPPASPRARRRARRLVARLALGLLALLLTAYLGISAYAANTLTTPRRNFAEARAPDAYGLAYRDVSFPARGGDVQIAGWYIPHAGSDRAVILVHGKDSSRTNEFQGAFPQFAAALHARGLAVLMIDMRGHGRSGDAHFSFGLNEQRDIQGAADWLKAQGVAPGKIGVLGVSMGAASSVLATAHDPDIGALVEDCSYAAIYPIIAREWRTASGLPDVFLPSTLLMSRLMFGYDLATSRPVDAIGEIAPRPVLIIHGTADRLIPISDAEQLHAALPSSELWEVPGAAHAGSYAANPHAYADRVAAFFLAHLK
jgi:dipeptidyl aminopeptidase/acylaminoacyl peptidase